jgi:N-[(2S)-2-amino-2-carboxyethyl]-L-glutamate dehydrogenase
MINPILFLNDRQVAELLPPPVALAAVETGLKLHASGYVEQPLKPYVRPGGRENEYKRGRVIFMPAFVGGDVNMIGAKIIAGFPANVDRGLPRASGLIVLNSAETGFPLAVMECAELSARRTAAVARICFERLAGTPPYSVAILGAGPIAAAVIDTLALNPGITGIRIFDPRIERAQLLALKKRLQHDIEVEAVREITCATHAADCLVTATVGSRGYLTPSIAGRKRLIVALSLDDASEDLFLNSDKIVVDSFDDCNREEKLLHRLVQRGRFSRAAVHAELGEILLGTKPGREHPEESIYVNPMGMAVEDVAAASVVYRTALQVGIGTHLN